MHKSITVALVAAFALLALPATLLMATVIPPIGLAPGSQYQLVFVTAGDRDARSSNIADYNSFVAAEAALNPLLPVANWHAVARTASVEAASNAPSFGLPTYNTQGHLVAPTTLYVADLTNAIRFDQFGDPGPAGRVAVWTGMRGGVTQVSGAYLGDLVSWFGDYKATFGWDHSNFLQLSSDGSSMPLSLYSISVNGTFQGNAIGTIDAHPLYALSEPITVPVPEPSTLVLAAALGLVGLAAWGGRRKR